VRFLQYWWPSAERRRQRGINDAGDVAGTPFVVEVKRAERWNIHGWLQELLQEQLQDHRRHNPDKAIIPPLADGFVMARRSRGEWVFIVPEATMQHLLDSVYGSPIAFIEDDREVAAADAQA
jgi:hypothetical protein